MDSIQTKRKKFIIENDSTVIIELMREEIHLINVLRNSLKFGEITIIMRDGIPVRVKRIEEFINLSDTLRR